MSMMPITSRYIFLIGLLFTIFSWSAHADDGAQVKKDVWVNIENDRANKVQEALSYGFNPNSLSKDKVPAIMEAVKEGSWKVYDILLNNPKIDLNTTAVTGESVLMYVLLIGDLTRAQDLINRGAAVNKTGWSPLHFAALSGKPEAVTLLLNHDAYIDAVSDMNVTPLMFAMKKGNIASVKLLLDAGADVQVKDYKNRTALDYAKEAGNDSLAKMYQEYLQVKQR